MSLHYRFSLYIILSRLFGLAFLWGSLRCGKLWICYGLKSKKIFHASNNLFCWFLRFNHCIKHLSSLFNYSFSSNLITRKENSWKIRLHQSYIGKTPTTKPTMKSQHKIFQSQIISLTESQTTKARRRIWLSRDIVNDTREEKSRGVRKMKRKVVFAFSPNR